MRLKGMEDLAAFIAREVKRAAAEEREREGECAISSAPINSRLNVVVRSPAPFGLGQNGCWPSRGSQLPQALPVLELVLHI